MRQYEWAKLFQFPLWFLFLVVAFCAWKLSSYLQHEASSHEWIEGRWQTEYSWRDSKNPLSAKLIQFRPGGSCRFSDYYGNVFREGEWTINQFNNRLTITADDPTTADKSDRIEWSYNVLFSDDFTLLLEVKSPTSNDLIGTRILYGHANGNW